MVEPRVWPAIDAHLCDGCGKCLAACASNALGLSAGKAILARPDQCRYDGNCELACPKGAIRVPYTITFGDDVPPGPTHGRPTHAA
jgi:NAD-dependent dihydropyrimidine dehydrogenase PreA subunit